MKAKVVLEHLDFCDAFTPQVIRRLVLEEAGVSVTLSMIGDPLIVIPASSRGEVIGEVNVPDGLAQNLIEFARTKETFMMLADNFRELIASVPEPPAPENELYVYNVPYASMSPLSASPSNGFTWRERIHLWWLDLIGN